MNKPKVNFPEIQFDWPSFTAQPSRTLRSIGQLRCYIKNATAAGSQVFTILVDRGLSSRLRQGQVGEQAHSVDDVSKRIVSHRASPCSDTRTQLCRRVVFAAGAVFIDGAAASAALGHSV